jgi:hypothetical protein
MLFTAIALFLLVQAVWGQSSTSLITEPTVPSWATIGVAQTPTVSNPAAVIAQEVCPGYSLWDIQKTDRGLTGSLSLNGSACNAYGQDYANLTLTVYYDTETRLHVTIEDVNQTQYRIPESLVRIPPPSDSIGDVDYAFNYRESPFSFWVTRSDGDILFDTRGYKLIFETQYLELTTNMEEDYNVYGLGEVIHSLRLHKNFTRTMWAKYFNHKTLLISVMKQTQLMEIFMAHIQFTFSTNIRVTQVDEITQHMPSIYVTQTEWILSFRILPYNTVLLVVFLTYTFILGPPLKMWSSSMSPQLDFQLCISTGRLGSINVGGVITIHHLYKMLLTYTEMPTSLWKLFGVISIVCSLIKVLT